MDLCLILYCGFVSGIGNVRVPFVNILAQLGHNLGNWTVIQISLHILCNFHCCLLTNFLSLHVYSSKVFWKLFVYDCRVVMGWGVFWTKLGRKTPFGGFPLVERSAPKAHSHRQDMKHDRSWLPPPCILGNTCNKRFSETYHAIGLKICTLLKKKYLRYLAKGIFRSKLRLRVMRVLSWKIE